MHAKELPVSSHKSMYTFPDLRDITKVTICCSAHTEDITRLGHYKKAINRFLA